MNSKRFPDLVRPWRVAGFAFFLIVTIFFFTTCEKPARVVKLTTLAASDLDIGSTTALLKGEITDLGADEIDDHGIFLSENTTPVQTNSIVKALGTISAKGVFQAQFTNLLASTKYYFRAYVSVNSVITYGEIRQLTTKASQAPAVSTGSFSELSVASVKLSGNVTSDGGDAVTKRGICWNTTSNPTLASCMDTTINGSGTGTFTGLIHGLTSATKYYARAYAINSKGTSYGDPLDFTTIQTSSATTLSATAFTVNSATLNGSVNANNLSTTVTFEYGQTTSYGINITAVQSPVTGNTSTAVSANITGLAAGTLYHFRVKAVNTAGTVDGGDMTFTTLEVPTAVTLAASTVTNNSATINGTVNAKNSSTTVTFEYGLTTAYGVSKAAAQSPVTGSTNTSVSANLTGLSQGTTYHYKVKATSAGGSAEGTDLTFITGQPPSAVTTSATNFSSSGATLNGTVNANNSSTTVTFEYGNSTSYGTTVNASQNPVTGNTPASVSAIINGLSPSTTYHFRVKATSSGGSSDGSDQTFNTTAVTGTIADYDGNNYNTVQIGTQIWMQANLNTTRYSNGEYIPNVTYPGAWGGPGGAYCDYLNTPSYSDTYGKLYNYTAVVDLRNICPTGWHAPSDAEWVTLIDYCGGESVAGDKLKEAGSSHWGSGNAATNSSGFTALPGGYRDASSAFAAIGVFGRWWTTTEEVGNEPYIRGVDEGSTSGRARAYFTTGLSVRCLKGSLPLVETMPGSPIASNIVMLKAKINPNGASTTVTFEYGTDTGYGNEIAATQNPVTGSLPVDVSAQLSGLTPGSTYHYRVKAVNSGGTSFGNDQTATTDQAVVSDVDGNFYGVIRIGNQLWMKENLKTTKYNDLTLITAGNSSNLGSFTTPAYCWYEDNEVTNKPVYGALYNWYAASTSKLCPTGWHVPTDLEFTELFQTLGGTTGGEATVGGKLKEYGTSHWATPNEGATNESGFTALPGGSTAGGLGNTGYWWGSTQVLDWAGGGFVLHYNDINVQRSGWSKSYGFSVRCVK
jgi:uncharacterized protein (TIGR02145 family)